jgi:hypothetical protein
VRDARPCAPRMPPLVAVLPVVRDSVNFVGLGGASRLGLEVRPRHGEGAPVGRRAVRRHQRVRVLLDHRTGQLRSPSTHRMAICASGLRPTGSAVASRAESGPLSTVPLTPSRYARLWTAYAPMRRSRNAISTPMAPRPRLASSTGGHPCPASHEVVRQCLRFEQESFGALHQMLSSLDPAGRDAAWAEVGAALREFEDGQTGFVGPCELVLAVETK